MPHTPACLVGVFDSGVGGLSVLKALHAHLPAHDLLYVADSAHAPYGERSDGYIDQRTHRIASHLLAEGAGMLVIACNTATAVSVAGLRERWPGLPIVAVEPGIKPAIAASRSKRIGVMATPTTLRSEKFKRLVAQHGQGAEIVLQPCPGLAGQIEKGNPQDPALLALIDQFTQPLKAAGVDTVVLGCTHYPFVIEPIQDALGPGVVLVDTAQAVARQAARLLPDVDSARSRRVMLQTTGDAGRLSAIASRWLPFSFDVAHAPGL
jgi:glutamate racemase